MPQQGNSTGRIGYGSSSCISQEGCRRRDASDTPGVIASSHSGRCAGTSAWGLLRRFGTARVLPKWRSVSHSFQFSSRSESWRPLAAALSLALAILWLYGGTIPGLVRQWATDEDYSH